MSLFFLIFVILIIHFSFFLQLYITGSNQISFFGWISEFNYSNEIADKCLIYITLCTIALCIGYMIKRKSNKSKRLTYYDDLNPIRTAKLRYLFRLTCIFQILIVLYVVIIGRANYALMTKIRESLNFFFELRIFPLLIFTYLLQYINRQTYKKYKIEICLFCLLCLLFVFVQARSLLVEVGCIIGYYFLKQNKNQIKIKYIVTIYIISIIPNIIVLGRLSAEQADLANIETWKNIFTYEYTILFNSILGETIGYTKEFLYGKTVFDGFYMLIPSFLRNMLGLIPDKTIISSIAKDAGVFGGGFSLFAEMYLNFGWFSVVLFFLMGYFLALQDNKWFNKSHITLLACTIPLIYSYVILGMRNDMAVLVKQIFQIYIVLYIVKILLKIKIFKHEINIR